jgi:hypothetical protein
LEADVRNVNVTLKEDTDSGLVYGVNTGLFIAVDFVEADVVLLVAVSFSNACMKVLMMQWQCEPFRSEQQREWPLLIEVLKKLWQY